MTRIIVLPKRTLTVSTERFECIRPHVCVVSVFWTLTSPDSDRCRYPQWIAARTGEEGAAGSVPSSPSWSRVSDPGRRFSGMGKLIYCALGSLDGYVADQDGHFDW